MRTIYYISPSTIPSRSANSIHVINMCEAIAQLGNKVLLFANSNDPDSNSVHQQISTFYGANISKISVNIFRSKKIKGLEFGIAINSFIRFFIDWIKGRPPEIIISRNLYATLFLSLIFRKNIIYETHSLENGFRKKIQLWLLESKKIKTVVISKVLKKMICDFHNIEGSEIYVFHDAAKAGRVRITNSQRYQIRKEQFSSVIDLNYYQKIIGYFGQLYSGRGIDVIQEIAKLNPSFAFIIYGGNEKEITKYKNKNNLDNLFFMGHLLPKSTYEVMRVMDVLLMPYKKSVSIGIKGIDTAEWMSPMKMFEYMSTGVPIISSNLPVIREVLKDNENCLLVDPDDFIAWSESLRSIVKDKHLAEKLQNNAYNEYKSKYTWEDRAQKILNLSNEI
tara:strand:- start:2562 stop:3737 length:1176 start_codon:yes stop_codon:yes gene_type:complete